MLQSLFFVLGLFLAISQLAAAQTWTSCNPLNGTCPGDMALGISNYTVDFTEGLDTNVWNVTAGTITTGSDGAEYVINKRFDSPTMQSEFYFMFGVVEVHMKGATGQGIISSIVLESDDLDEVDWELIGGNTTTIETNYFGKGNQTVFDRAFYYPVTVGGGPMDTYHNYTIHWTSDALEWYIDTALVRTLKYEDANGGDNYPQTPMTLRMGIWAGGDEGNSEGTIEWAGGKTDYSQAPFRMLVQSARVSDYGTGKEYTYSDTSGSWQSITSTAGTSTVAEEIENASASKSTSASSDSSASASSSSSASSSTSSSAAAATTSSESMAQKWSSMSNTAHVAVYAGGSVAIVALAGLIGLCCIKQRRRGMKDRAAEAARLEAQRKEDEAYSGMELKEQDALPLSTPTPAQYASKDDPIKDQSYYASREMPNPPPVYQSVPMASPSGHNGAGFNFDSNANSRGPGSPAPVSPVSPAGFVNSGYVNNGYSNNGFSNHGSVNHGYGNNGGYFPQRNGGF